MLVLRGVFVGRIGIELADGREFVRRAGMGFALLDVAKGDLVIELGFALGFFFLSFSIEPRLDLGFFVIFLFFGDERLSRGHRSGL